MKSVRTNREARCPACQHRVDGATDPRSNRTPKPGDFSVCAYCSMVVVFNTDMTVRAARPAEIEALPAGTRAEMRAYQAMALAIASKRAKGTT